MRIFASIVALTAMVATMSAAQAPKSSMPEVGRMHRERVTCHNAYDALVDLQKASNGSGATVEQIKWGEAYEAAADAKQPCPAPPASVYARAVNRTVSHGESANRLVKYLEAGDPAAYFEAGQGSWEETLPGMKQLDGINFFRRAAELGDPDGNFMMARLYLGGQFGTKGDWKGAYPYMERAAKGGHVDAIMFVGLNHYEGAMGRKDHKAAFANFSQAAERGQVYATYMAAWMANNGEGTKKDHKLAYRLARNLSAQGEPAAGAVLAASALMYDNPRQNEDEVFYWMDMAIRTGDAKVSEAVTKLRPQVVSYFQRIKTPPPAYQPRAWKVCPMKTVCMVNSYSGVRQSCTTNKDYWSDCDG